MIISEADATWAADEFINYFGNFTSIEDYLRFVKKELVPRANPLVSMEDAVSYTHLTLPTKRIV